MRRTKPIDYIRLLKNSNISELVDIGEELESLYFKWKKSLEINDVIDFIEAIEEKYAHAIEEGLGRMPQSIGQFRAYSLEEYLYDITSKVLKDNYSVLWNEKIPVWNEGFEYGIAQDIVIADKNLNPLVVVEAKVEVDAQRLKAVLMNFSLLKMTKKPKCALVYVRWNADEKLKFISKKIAVDEIFDFNRNSGEVERYKNWLKVVLL